MAIPTIQNQQEMREANATLRSIAQSLSAIASTLQRIEAKMR